MYDYPVPVIHDDVIKWKHFPRYWPFLCEGNPPVNSGFPPQRPVTRNFDIFFDLSEQTVEQTFGTPVIWDALLHIKTSL